MVINNDSRLNYWKEQIEDLHASDMTQKEWCEQQGISLSTLRYWIRKVKKESMSNPDMGDIVFAKLPSEGDILSTTTSAPVILDKAGIRIRIYPSCSRKMMGDLISVLQCHV